MGSAYTNAGTVSVAAFTGSATMSSRRFRVLQYAPLLAAHGVHLREHVARFGSWPPRSRMLRPSWFVATLVNRIAPVVQSHFHDVTLLQRELVSTFLTLEPFTKRPRVLDVDDAIWLNGGRAERSFKSLVRMCDGVMCGNSYIESTVKQWGSSTLLLPTAVDTHRFIPRQIASQDRMVIGWSGLHAGSKYLLGIEDALYEVLSIRRDAVLRVVSDRRPDFTRLKESMVEYIPWSPANEVETIQGMTVGLMPIDDTLWSRGKCSYKMLLYMSCGIPVVVSPYGMNAEVLAKGRVGCAAVSQSDWTDALLLLLGNREMGAEMGREGRRVVEGSYSLCALASRMAAYLREFKR